LAALVRDADRVGCGLMSHEARALYATIHRAALCFPLLRAEHHKNFATLRAAFERAVALKYTEPRNDVVFDDPFAFVGSDDDAKSAAFFAGAPRDSSLLVGKDVNASALLVSTDTTTVPSAARSIFSTGALATKSGAAVVAANDRAHMSVMSHGSVVMHTSTLAGGSDWGGLNSVIVSGGGNNAAVEEERSLLAIRSAQLGVELSEARQALVATNADLEASQLAVSMLRSDNETLRAELARLRKALSAAVNGTV
jgi:hypothetical protein